MNIFYLSHDPREAAAFHCDKHVVKMIVETAQMLSTAHRLLDGQLVTLNMDNLQKKIRLLPGEQPAIIPGETASGRRKLLVIFENAAAYHATHANHPSNVWLRENRSNYAWGVELLQGLLCEFETRYGRTHSTARFVPFLKNAPANLLDGSRTAIPLAMPDEYKQEDPVAAYRAFYRGEKSRFAAWRNGEPTWWSAC